MRFEADRVVKKSSMIHTCPTGIQGPNLIDINCFILNLNENYFSEGLSLGQKCNMKIA